MPLSEDTINAAAEKVTARIKSVNDLFLSKIGERIAEIGKMKATDINKLTRMSVYGKDIDAITRALSEASNKSESDIIELLTAVAKDNYAWSEQLYKAKGIDYVPFAQNKELQSLIKSYAKSTIIANRGLVQTVAFMIRDKAGKLIPTELSKAYQKTVEQAALAVATGETDYQSAIRQTLRDLADSGLRTTDTGKVVDYASGYSRRLDTAVRQNVLWGAKQANLGYQDQIGEQFGADGYEIDYHPNPRPSHEAMGGQQYAIGGAKTIDGVYYPCFEDEAEPLLEDYGCLHFKFPIILGVSEPNWDKSELAAMKAADREKIEFEGKTYTKYEAKQIQRKLETAARHQKDRATIAKAAGDDVLRRDAQEKINIISHKYKAFSDAAGLPTKMQRMTGAGFRPVKTRAELKTPPLKDVTSGAMAQYDRYCARLGRENVGTFGEFIDRKNANGEDWTELQRRYRYAGIDERIREHHSDYTFISDKDHIPPEYNDCAFALSAEERAPIFTYSEYANCPAINTYAATGKVSSPEVKKTADTLHEVLDKMSLPHDTVVYRGTKAEYLDGFEEIKVRPISEWKDRTIGTKAFTSTSLFRDTAYDAEVELTILIPEGQKGAGYINEISYNKAHAGENIGGVKITEEYEVLLQNGSKYDILEAQIFKGKIFMTLIRKG